jgi:hypothetical protein
LAVALISAAAHAATDYLVSDAIRLGGSGPDRVTEMVLDSAGNAYVAGVILSYDFPGLSSGAVANAGYGMRFVSRIDAISRTPAWVTVVGAPTGAASDSRSTAFATDEAQGLAIDQNGNAYVAAYEGSKDFPLYGGTYRWSGSKYVFRVTPTGQSIRHSIALDTAIRRVAAIALDSSGNLYLAGSAGAGMVTTAGAPFATTSVAPGCIAPFVLKLDPSGQTVLYATYLGTAGTQAGDGCGNGVPGGMLDPTAFDIAVDSAGNAYVTGEAEPGLRATSGSPDFGAKTGTLYSTPSHYSAAHAFVSKINAAGTAVVFTARLGGSNRDRGTSIKVDASGAIYVAGKTTSSDFPAVTYLVFPFPIVARSCLTWTPEVGFIAKLSSDGKQIVFSGFLPAEGRQIDDCANHGGDFAPVKLALGSGGILYAAGFTDPANRDVSMNSNGIHNLSGDRFLMMIDPSAPQITYGTWLTGGRDLRAIAVDSSGSVMLAGGGATLQKVSQGLTPVTLTANPNPSCVSSASTLAATIAGAGAGGTVEFFVDDQSVGTAQVAAGGASKPVSLALGVRKIQATYHGPAYFDGYSSAVAYLPVNQAGACQ